MKDKFTDDLRDLMAGFEEPVSGGLWDRVEGALPARRRSPLVWLLPSVAVAAALAVGVILQKDDSIPEAPHQRQSVVAEATIGTDAGTDNTIGIDTDATIGSESTRSTIVPMGHTGKVAAVLPTKPEKATGRPGLALPGISFGRKAEAFSTSSFGIVPARERTREEGLLAETLPADTHEATPEEVSAQWRDYLAGEDSEGRKAARPLSLGLGMGSGILPEGSSQMNTPRMSDTSIPAPPYFSPSNFNAGNSSEGGEEGASTKAMPGIGGISNYNSEYGEYGQYSATNSGPSQEKLDHSLPLALSLRLSYGLSEKFSLESGVSYTRMSADIEGGARSGGRQELSFIGVPILARYTPLSRGRFSLYGEAGPQIDFCVGAKFKRDGVSSDIHNVSPMVNAIATVGVQLNLAKGLGVYVEPGAVINISSDGTTKNYYSDKGIVPSITVGLRYSIK